MKRTTILIATLALAMGIGCGDSSSDGGDDGASGSGGGGSGSDRTDAIAEALTSSVDFPGGEVNDGPIPLATEEDVDVTSEDGTLELAAAETSVMSMDVDNPDEDEDPVAAVLVQFEDADEHVEVEAMLDETGYFESEFTMGEGVCDELCDEVHEITMFVAVKLEGGGVSPKHERPMLLDCTETGDPGSCEQDPEPSGGGSFDPKDYLDDATRLVERLCLCADPECDAVSDATDCVGTTVNSYADDFNSKQLACASRETKKVTDCLETSATACGTCGEEALAGAIDQECGAFPEGLVEDLGACAEMAGLATGAFGSASAAP